MTSDLKQQIRGYTEYFVTTIEPVDVSDAARATGEDGSLEAVGPAGRRAPAWQRPWFVVVMAAVVVLVAVGGGALLIGGAGDGAPTTPSQLGTPATAVLDPSGPAEVLLGDEHVWPKTPRPGTPFDIAEAFASEVLGWDDSLIYVDPDADPSGPVWVRLDPRFDVVELVDLLAIPHPDGGRVIAEVGTPWAHGASVFPAPGQVSGSSVGLLRVRTAATAEVNVRLTDGRQVVVAADMGRDGVIVNRVDIPEITDPASIASVLVRYLDEAGAVVAVSGGSV